MYVLTVRLPGDRYPLLQRKKAKSAPGDDDQGPCLRSHSGNRMAASVWKETAFVLA